MGEYFFKKNEDFNSLQKRKDVKPTQSLNSDYPFQFIHVDTTLLQTSKDGSIRAVIIKDNYSKKILHFGVVESGYSRCVALLIKDVFASYRLQSIYKPMAFVSDGGSENKGEVIDWINNLECDNITKLTAKTEGFRFTNNEIESNFNIFKNEFLASTEIIDKHHARKLLADFQLYNYHERYPLSLFGLTPQEVFDGGTPDQ